MRLRDEHLREVLRAARDEHGTSHDEIASARGMVLRRLQRRRRLAAGGTGLAVASIAFAGFLFVGSRPPSAVPIPGGSPSSSPTPTVEPTETAATCETFPLPFEPGYLPPDFSNTAEEGGAEGAGGYAGHYQGPAESIHISFGPADEVGPTIEGPFADIMKRPATFSRVDGGWGASFQVRGCGTWTMRTMGVGEDEASKVAEGLLYFEPETIAAGEVPGVWPDVATCDAAPSDSPLRGGASTALAFAQQFLEWDDPVVVFAREEGNRFNHYLLVRLTTPEADLMVYMDHPTRNGCWFVTGAQPPAALNTPTGFSISVEGTQLHVGADAMGADEVEWRIFVPDRETVTTTPGGELIYEFSDGPPQTEWVLIAILRKDGRPFGVRTIVVPPGDFSAG